MRIPVMFSANLKLKLLSLIFAVVLWLLVTLEASDMIEIPLAVKVMNLPQGLALQQASLPLISLRIAGPRTLLIRQKWHGATVELDFSGAKAGGLKFSGLDRHVRLDAGIRAVHAYPATVEYIIVNKDS
jgi:hypothetical protein